MQSIFMSNSKNLPAHVVGWELLLESRLFPGLLGTQTLHNEGTHPRQTDHVLCFTC